MEAAILQFFASLRCPFADAVFSAFSFFGEETFAAAAALILFCFSRREGERAIAATLTAACLTAGIKGAIRRPRPFAAGVVPHGTPQGLLAFTADTEAGLSFPSGHAAAAASLLGSLALGCKRIAAALPFALLPLLTACSRLYFGVHYPTDVLAGLALGAGSALLWRLVYARFYDIRLYLLAGTLLPLAAFIPLSGGKQDLLRTWMLTAGLEAGLLLENLLARPAAGEARCGFFRLLLTAAAAAAVFLPLHRLLPAAPQSGIAYFAAAFAAAGIVPILLKCPPCKQKQLTFRP